MTSNRHVDEIDRRMAGWMEAEGRVALPDGLVDGALTRTRTARRRHRWLLSEWWLPMQQAARFQVVWNAAPLVLLVAALVLIAAVFVLLAGGQRRVPAPFGVAADGRLVVDTNGSLVVADVSGGGTRPLVEGVVSAAGAVFSRDGSRLVFWGDGSPDTLYLANADGSGVRRLVGELWISTDKSPTWSPDGRYVAISTESGPDRLDEHLLVIDTGSGVASTVRSPELDAVRAVLPAWSPDGIWIGFVGIERGDRSERPSYWVVHPDGSGAHELPTSPLSADAVVAPHWAPDPGRLRLAYSAEDAGQRPTAVELLDVATGRETRLSTGGSGLWPAWSPDARSIAWVTDRTSGDLRIAASDGSAPSREIPGTGIGGPPAWSPDGRHIYGPNDLGTTLVVVAADGSAPPLRIPHGASQALPDWQRVIP